MNTRASKSHFLTIGFIINAIVTILLLVKFAWESDRYYDEVIVIIVSSFIILQFYTYTISLEEFDFFHTIHLVTVIYWSLFVLTPLFLIHENRVDSFGINVMPGCIKATTIFTFAFISFLLGYKRLKVESNYSIYHTSVSMRKRILMWSWIMYIFSFMMSMYYLSITGRSIKYVFTLGNGGVMSPESTNLLFLSNFTLSMIVPLIYLFKYIENKLYFLFPAFLTFSIFYVRGFRIFIMILIVALVIFYFKNKAKKISFYSLILFVIMTLSINTLLGVVRNSLRSGGGTENVSVGSKEFLYTLESNFDIYKPFYSLVTKYPSQYDFTMGESIIQDSFTMWIPRSLWENKPLAEDYTMPIGLRRSVSDFAVLHAGLAWPNIAEFYMEFGSLGCVLIFYFFGRICKSINMLYYSENAHFLVAYSVAYTLLLQFIIRGAVSLFIPFLVFTLLPFVVIFFVTKENKS